MKKTSPPGFRRNAYLLPKGAPTGFTYQVSQPNVGFPIIMSPSKSQPYTQVAAVSPSKVQSIILLPGGMAAAQGMVNQYPQTLVTQFGQQVVTQPMITHIGQGVETTIQQSNVPQISQNSVRDNVCQVVVSNQAQPTAATSMPFQVDPNTATPVTSTGMTTPVKSNTKPVNSNWSPGMYI